MSSGLYLIVLILTENQKGQTKILMNSPVPMCYLRPSFTDSSGLFCFAPSLFCIYLVRRPPGARANQSNVYYQIIQLFKF